ncbi:MAG: hypothetical protein JSV21_07270 [Nitrospirota bacterium]|nr:MAG: hypothetical protein JSV21_07270 [Nitrospirota bacterium]
MKKTRIILYVFIAVIVIIAGVLYFAWENINPIVKAAIEKYGGEVSKTNVGVSSVDIKVFSGEGAINGLSISNPQGFESKHAFKLGSISTKIDTGSITKDTVVIDEIMVSAPEVMFEINKDGRSNIDALKKNVLGSGEKKEKDAVPEKKKGRDIGIHIRSLIVEKGNIGIKIPALGIERSAELPRIELKDIGKGGAPPREVAEKIIMALINKVGPAVAGKGVEQYLGKDLEEMKKKIEKQAKEKVQEELEKGLKDQPDDVKGSIKKLLGK